MQQYNSWTPYNSHLGLDKIPNIHMFFSKSNNIFYLLQESFLHKILAYFERVLKIFSIFTMKLMFHTFASFGTTKALKLIEGILERFYKDKLLSSPKFHW